MKLLKLICATIGVSLGLSFACHAQGFGNDEFAGVRSLTLAQGKMALLAASNASPVTVDLIGLIGIAKVDLFWGPDNASGVGTFTVQSSSDATNWSTLGNVAWATNYPVLRTNYYATGGVNYSIAVTDTNLLPATGITTPTASSAGFATTYTPALAFTNTATIPLTGPVVTEFGFIVSDANRYMRLVVVPSGTGTNCAFGGVITGAFNSGILK